MRYERITTPLAMTNSTQLYLGVPEELCGFSNHVRGTLGPAKWAKAKFAFHRKRRKIEIQVK